MIHTCAHSFLSDAPPEALAVSAGGTGKRFRAREVQTEALSAAAVKRAWYGWRKVFRAGYVSAEPLAGTGESGQRAARDEGEKPERFKVFSAGPGARAAGRSRPMPPTGML